MDPRVQRSLPTSPLLAPVPYNTQSEAASPASRWMSIKVLYTFDEDKAHCLARCSHPQLIQTAMLDEAIEIGIVELRTCVDAIISASPELVAKLGQDYTVYAYDYSEYETPLVGQGMLSWVLAASSSTPTAPADQSKTMVTGRVTRGTGLGLFSTGGARETLEVKLKMVPVPTSLQSEYLASLEKYRDASKISDPAFDGAAWGSFIRSQNSDNYLNTQSHIQLQSSPTLEPAAPSPNIQSSVPYQPTPQSGAGQLQWNPVNAVVSYQRPSSRPSTPKQGRSTSQRSRPSSRNSSRSRPPLKHSATAPVLDTMRIEDCNDSDAGRPRKRARVEQADWSGPSTFDASNEPLRVSASAAASIRSHRPSGTVAMAAPHIASAEPGARPPTPRPEHRAQNLLRNNSVVAHEALTRKARSYHSPYSANADHMSSDSGLPDSQEDDDRGSVRSTPFDMPSSPPILRSASPILSSPPLPMRSAPDSGFVSGAPDEDLFSGDSIDGPSAKATKKKKRPASSKAPQRFDPDFSFEEQMPGDPSLLPTGRVVKSVMPSATSGRCRRSSTTCSSPLQHTASLVPSFPRTNQHGTNSLTEDQHLDASNSLLCADFTSQDMTTNKDQSQPASRPVTRPEPDSTIAPLEQCNSDSALLVGTGSRRKKIIQTRLEADLAAGNMPPFCKNCGEINTPTWRKCYVRVEQGSPGQIDLSEQEDGIFAWDIAEAKDGVITAYRLIKRKPSFADDGFEEMQICNSCGIWLFKHKSMRPSDKWEKQPPKYPSKRRVSRGKSAKTLTAQSSTENPGQTTSRGGAAEINEQEGPDDASFSVTTSGRSDRSQPKTTGDRTRSASIGVSQKPTSDTRLLSDAAAAAALQRAIQSSPPKFPGSQAVPFEIAADDAHDTVRRLLFPSPRKNGEVKSLDEFGETSAIPASISWAADAPPHCPEQENDLQAPTALQDQKQLTPSRPSDLSNDLLSLLQTPNRSTTSKHTTLSGRRTRSSTRKNRSNPETPSRAMHRDFHGNLLTPFSAELQALIAANQSPTRFSDSAMNQMLDQQSAAPDSFVLSDFLNDDFNALPQSDADFFPVFDDSDMQNEPWYGGPLLDGELEELLQDAGEDAIVEENNEGSCVRTTDKS